VDSLGESAREARIAGNEAAHFVRIAGDNNDQAVAVILHKLEQRLDGLAPEITLPPSGGKAVGLVDEQNSIECRAPNVHCLHRGLADIAADELASVRFDQVAFA